MDRDVRADARAELAQDGRVVGRGPAELGRDTIAAAPQVGEGAAATRECAEDGLARSSDGPEAGAGGSEVDHASTVPARKMRVKRGPMGVHGAISPCSGAGARLRFE